MMIKYRVREVAKDLDIPNKDVIDILAKYFPEPKKYMTALTEEELDVVFEAFTQQRSMKSLDEYFAQRAGQREWLQIIPYRDEYEEMPQFDTVRRLYWEV